MRNCGQKLLNCKRDTFFTQSMRHVLTHSQQLLVGTCSRGRDKLAAVASPIIKCWTDRSEMSNPQTLCEVLVYYQLPEIPALWPLSKHGLGRWTFFPCSRLQFAIVKATAVKNRAEEQHAEGQNHQTLALNTLQWKLAVSKLLCWLQLINYRHNCCAMCFSIALSGIKGYKKLKKNL